MRMHFLAATAVVSALGTALFGPNDIDWPVAPHPSAPVAVAAAATAPQGAGEDDIEWP